MECFFTTGGISVSYCVPTRLKEHLKEKTEILKSQVRESWYEIVSVFMNLELLWLPQQDLD